jgi:hypothetical protein
MSAETEDPIEIMARAIQEAPYPDPYHSTFDMLSEEGANQRRCEARLALRALDAAGYAIVPKEPDDKINNAGQHASNSYPAVPTDYVWEPVHTFTVTQMWRAMVKAAAVKP